jgi:circadian clock protein KaiB
MADDIPPLPSGRPPPTVKYPASWTVDDASPHYTLRLYVTGASPRSVQAIASVKALCQRHLSDHYDLQVVDLYSDPNYAQSANVIASPTLVKMLPLPERRIVGNLDDSERFLTGLEIANVW